MAAPSYVFTIAYVAEMLGEDEEWLHTIADDMEPEDGCLWVRGIGNTATRAVRDRKPQRADANGQTARSRKPRLIYADVVLTGWLL